MICSLLWLCAGKHVGYMASEETCPTPRCAPHPLKWSLEMHVAKRSGVVGFKKKQSPARSLRLWQTTRFSEHQRGVSRCGGCRCARRVLTALVCGLLVALHLDFLVAPEGASP